MSTLLHFDPVTGKILEDPIYDRFSPDDYFGKSGYVIDADLSLTAIIQLKYIKVVNGILTEMSQTEKDTVDQEEVDKITLQNKPFNDLKATADAIKMSGVSFPELNSFVDEVVKFLKSKNGFSISSKK